MQRADRRHRRGITAGVGSFLSVFMVRLGATDFQVGLLTAMPALTGMLLAMPVGEFLSRRTHIVPWFARSRFVVLICYLLTGLVPFFIPNRAPGRDHPDLGAGHPAADAGLGGIHRGDGRRRRAGRPLHADEPALGDPGADQLAHGVGRRPDAHALPVPAELPGRVHRLGGGRGDQRDLLEQHQAAAAGDRREPRWVVDTFRAQSGTLRENKPFVRFTVSQFVFRSGMAMAGRCFPIYWVKTPTRPFRPSAPSTARRRSR